MMGDKAMWFRECGLSRSRSHSRSLGRPCFRQQRGLSLIGWLLIIPLVLIGLLILAIGFYEGRKAYWDYRVREMCEKDGGVRISEQIIVSPTQATLIPKVGEFFGVMPEALAKPEEPAFSRIQRSVIHEYNPSVIRHQEELIRRADQRVVGVVVTYGRGGGDFPSPSHPSSYQCPDPKHIYGGIHQIYRVVRENK